MAYQYLTLDLRTGALQAELSLQEVTFDRKLNGAGSVTGVIAVNDPAVIKSRQVSAITEGKSGLLVVRDGVILWSGIIWTTVYDSTRQLLQVNGTEDWSGYAHRVITVDLPLGSPAGTGYVGADELFVVCDILNWANAQTGGNLGVIIPTPPVSGVGMDLKMRYYEKRTVSEAVTKISQQAGGFDFAIDCNYENGVPVKRFNIGFPRRGRPGAKSGLLFDAGPGGGNIVNYTLSTDATSLATAVYGLGAGNADLMLAGQASNAAMIAAGYPLWETVVSYKDQTTGTNIQNLTQAQLNILSNVPANSAPTLPQVVVRADVDPVLGSYTIGDEARFRITDGRYPAKPDGTAGFDGYYRITAMSVTSTHANQKEQVTLTLGQPWTQ